MIAYAEFLRLSQSSDSAERGRAAHFAASAYLSHDGAADEQAALYAAVMGFLDDPSVKVRAALAYGLLRSERAPRPIMIALLQDAGIIARAVAQYSPVLLDADLVAALAAHDSQFALAVCARVRLGLYAARALLSLAEPAVRLAVVARHDVHLDRPTLFRLAGLAENDAALRGELLARPDLPADARLLLVDQVRAALAGTRIVAGAIAPKRLERLLRDARDTALVSIGESEVTAGDERFVGSLVAEDKVSTRLLLHALMCGHVEFFSACAAQLADMPSGKAFAILERGGRPALDALISRCGMGAALRDLMVRLIMHARSANLADDLSARYFVVSSLIEELIIEYGGDIPEIIADAFSYLNEQNVVLARKAARGVMRSFAATDRGEKLLPVQIPEGTSLLPAA